MTDTADDCDGSVIDALKKRLIDAQNASTFGSYVDRMAAGGELGAATLAVFVRLAALETVAKAAREFARRWEANRAACERFAETNEDGDFEAASSETDKSLRAERRLLPTDVPRGERGAMTDPALDFSTEAMTGPKAAPEKPYLSNQIGCSEIAPLMIALGTDEGMPPRVRAWMELARERAAYGRHSKKVPQHLKSPAFEGPVWCIDNAAKVRTEYGPLPYCIATKAGVYEKDAQKDYQKAGHDLELRLWRRWIDSLRLDPDCQLDVDTLRSQHDVLAMYPAAWNVRAPSVKHPEEQRLVTYLDGWGQTIWSETAVMNAKLSHDWKEAPDVPALIQMHGEIACCRASVGILIYGQKWNAGYMQEAPEDRGPPAPFPIDPDAGAERAILATVAKAWEVIDGIRAEMSIKRKVSTVHLIEKRKTWKAVV